jgi:hypothetical protein
MLLTAGTLVLIALLGRRNAAARSLPGIDNGSD